MSAAPYEIRTNDNGRSRKQSMAELKLRRLTELNQRLQEDLNRRRIPVSEAAVEYVFLMPNKLLRDAIGEAMDAVYCVAQVTNLLLFQFTC
jgi:guanine nucleotide-binding protein subunit gamma